ncbi:grainyhead-like protein 1 homolog isoform X2 [Lineus longissimus]|uniref:grainyhead-like protein 1 homolog isoform X2 n=1 Tax=Lineus longissimus TaxID=88925 RepID=UPI00315C7BAC
MASVDQKEERHGEGLFKEVSDTYICWDKSAVENIPADVNAFFGHPLTAATNAIEGADSLALLHEYQNLPPIDTNKGQYHYVEIGDTNKITTVDELLVLDSAKSEASPIHSDSPKPQDLRVVRASESEMILATSQELSREQMVIFSQSSVPHTSGYGQFPVYTIPMARPQTTVELNVPPKNKQHAKKARRRPNHAEMTYNLHQANETQAPTEQGQHQVQHQTLQPSPSPQPLQYQEPAVPPMIQQLQQHRTFQLNQIPTFHPLQPNQQKQQAHATFSMDTLNNNVPNFSTSVAQSHSALQAALNSKPLALSVISQPNYQTLAQTVNTPTIKYETHRSPAVKYDTHNAHVMDNLDTVIQRTVNPSTTWTPSTNCQTTFSQSAHVQINSDASPVMSQGTFTNGVGVNSHLSHPVQQMNPRESNASDRHEVLSVDSGISDSCVSPTHPSPRLEPTRNSQFTVEKGSSAAPKAKRRQSTGSSTCTNRQGKEMTIPKRNHDNTGFHYFLEAPTSTFQKLDEDRVTYINKSQYYGLTLECNLSARREPSLLRSDVVKSVVIVVLRCEKNVEESAAWELWYSRQHNVKQRVIDIDTKNSSGIIIESIHELAHNALSFHWRPREGTSRASIALHCLSTDFSNQKGVKGVPLHLQIDTFEEVTDRFPVHRAYCQVKAFCDKGAERKLRDEERRKEAKIRLAESRPTRRRPVQTHPASNRSEFYSMLDLEKTPFLFYGYQVPNQNLYNKCGYPSPSTGTRYSNPSPSPTCQCNCGCHDSQTLTYSPSKKPKVDDGQKNRGQVSSAFS